MKAYFLALTVLFCMQSVFAEQNPNLAAICTGRKLYWVDANNSVKTLRKIENVNKLTVLSYLEDKHCEQDAKILNFQIVNTKGKFLISGDLKYYWVSAETTLQDILEGRIRELNPRYAYSAQDAVNVPTKVNLPPFIGGNYHALVNKDFDSYDEARKQKQLQKHFTDSNF